MKQLVLVLIALLVFFAVVVGVLFLLRPNGGSSVLASAECSPPCWHGILPGETTPWQAVDILAAKAWVGSIEQQGESYEDTQLSWVFLPPITDSAGFIYSRQGRVIAIAIMTMGSLSLGDLLEEFGEPESLWLTEGGESGRRWVEANLLYPEVGIIASVDIDWPIGVEPEALTMASQNPVARVAYVDPARLDQIFAERILFRQSQQDIQGSMRRWSGLGPISPP
jgi:hypothetical protein